MDGSTQTASPGTLRFWSAIATTFRPYLAFVSGGAALVGLSFASSPPVRSAVAFVPLFLSYGLGQALTDCFQTDTDALSSPYRPLVRGVVSRRQVLVVTAVGLAASALVIAALNPFTLVLATLAVAGLLLYTPLKRTWWGGPPCNAAVVALLPVLARLVDGADPAAILAAPRGGAFCAAVAAVFLGYADFVVIGYLKDISADRATGYRTFPVSFGWGATVVYGDLLALGSAGAAAAALASIHARPVAWAVLLGAVAVAAHAHVTAHRLRDERAAFRPIAAGVRAFVLTCAALALAARPGWLGALAIFHALFELTLRCRPERTQV